MEKYLIHDFSESCFAREPVLRRLKSGILVCSFLTGGTSEPQNKNVVMLSKSYDDGRTWTKPKTAVSHSERGCWATEIFTETDRPFLAVHTYNTDDWRREHYRELETFCLYLDGDGEPIGEPVSFRGAMNGVSVRQGIVLSDGETLFPVYWQEVVYDFDWSKNTAEEHGGKERYPFRCGAAISGKDGVFRRYGYLSDENHLWEPNCIEWENGHVMMLMRSGGENYLYRSDSYDYGRTWTKAEKTDIENAHTKIALFKIGKTVFLVNNYCNTNGMKNRTHLQIRSSEDGKNWRYVGAPEREETVCFYPHACVCEENKTVYLAYEDSVRHYLTKWSFEELLK